MALVALIFSLLIGLGFSPVLPSPAFAYHNHSLVAEYVSWGVDEYELFGLSVDEIATKFRGTLEYEEPKSTVFFVGYRRAGYGQPQYIVTFAGGKVATVQRLFIDGGGCHIIGPVLKSKREAINFTIDGLMKNPNRSAKVEERLKTLRKMLADMDKAAAPKK